MEVDGMKKSGKGNWERLYQGNDILWGVRPQETLIKYEQFVSKDGKVLDLGMGEGRNALYFAHRGFETEGIDISETAVARSLAAAEKLNVHIKAEVMDIREIQIDPDSCSLIILSNVLNFFTKEDVLVILDKVKAGLKKGGLVYIQAFDTNDPSYKKNVEESIRVDERTFHHEKTDSYIHYFTKTSLEELFTGERIIESTQSYLLDAGHGEPHYHGIVQLFVQVYGN
jgi:tellurite methyltransferase